jgi:hypothetical protein
VIPHYIVLAFLWLAFAVLSVVAFFAILFTGRYPRSIFDFNVGVLRWTWRAGFYAFAANGTDRYPPFALRETDYPATLSVEYPERLSRGLVLVKSWLLAIPHYIVVGFFAGGGAWLAWKNDTNSFRYGGGLIGILVLVAVVVLLFTGRYPQTIFDFVMGMNRWIVRVAAYAGLMTDRYPPFRLDMGGGDAGALAVDAPPAPGEPPATGAVETTWGAGRVLLVVFGSMLTLCAAALLAGGVAMLVLDTTQRDSQGFVSTPYRSFSTPTYALVSERVEAHGGAQGWTLIDRLVGTVRIRTRSTEPVFVGIAPARDVDRYLAGVPRETVRDFGETSGRVVGGTARPAPPASQSFWVAKASGSGTHALRWKPRSGDWRVVAMRPDAARRVATDAAVGARFPHMLGIAIGVLIGGAALLGVALVLLYVAIRAGRPEPGAGGAGA